MKRLVLFTILTALAVSLLPAADADWAWDAEKADSLFYERDYDSAWLFYERAMVAGLDDAKVLFRAAESFANQQIVDNPEFGEALYAVSYRFLQDQYPDDNVVAIAEARTNTGIVVNRSFIRRTYGMVGAKAPRNRQSLTMGFVGRIAAFLTARVEEIGTFGSILLTEGVGEAIGWARGRVFGLLLSYLIVALIPGIILPAVLAVTVAREGRKSYVTAYLFLIFWGPLGIHRFYIGRYISGIIWLFTGGLAGLGLFFDIFLTGAYIRFWNEDNRGDRPNREGSGTSRRVRSAREPKPPRERKPRKAKTPRAPKPPREKKASRPKPPKAPKPRKEKKPRQEKKNEELDIAATAGAASAAGASLSMEGVPDSASDAVLDEGFTFDDTSDGGSFEAGADSLDDFGELPDLDLGGDDFDIPSVGDGDDGLKDLTGGADEDEFDLGSLE